MLTFPTASLEQSLRAIWGAVSQAAVLILPQTKLNSQSHVVPLFLVDSSFMLPFSFFQIYALLLLFCNFYHCAIMEFIHSTIFLTKVASLTADHSSYGSWALEPGSVFVVCGHSCSVACGIFQDQGSNMCPLHWQVDSLPLSHQVSLGNIIFFC